MLNSDHESARPLCLQTVVRMSDAGCCPHFQLTMPSPTGSARFTAYMDLDLLFMIASLTRTHRFHQQD